MTLVSSSSEGGVNSLKHAMQNSPKSCQHTPESFNIGNKTLVTRSLSALPPGSRRCPILAMPVEPNNQPTEVDELRAELAEVEEIERNMVELLTLVQDEREGNEGNDEVHEGKPWCKTNGEGNDEVNDVDEEELDEYPEILELADLPTFQPSAPEGELIESQTTNPFESDRIAEEDLVDSADALNALNAGDSRSEEFPRLHEEHDELEPSLRSETVSLTGSVGSVDEDWHRCFRTLVCLQHMNNIEQLLTASK